MSLVLEKVSRAVGGRLHLQDVSLDLERGTVNVLLGPTGSGKTSLLRVMAGLDFPTTGRVRVDGKDVTGVSVRHRSVAMVYQQFVNYPTLSVFENIASPLRVARLPKSEVARKVHEVASLLKLEACLERMPGQLSGGQQQRTALARALAKGADLVLLDEPLANLDYKLREELREELPRIFEASGAMFVHATTDPTEALLLGGRTATLWEGRVTQCGPTLRVYGQPRDLRTASLFSDPPLNSVGARKGGPAFVLPTGASVPAAGALARLADGDYVLAFRAHQLRLIRPSPDALAVTGIVALTEITGSESYVHADVGGARWVALVPGVHEIAPGHATELFVDPRSLLVFEPSGERAAAPDPPHRG